ncbi:hypothetical protein E5329_23705 [Petralouisia muris]|uniref:Uncharacterized protein n=1 Tax=Petralouisia muris TaxID=3032872 RepID=A0AC61RPD1_9FIRM|nr:hypothetical protein [Petralouisia muris]TGY90898.1 hypothetical protein E5329_23705 [Petralouisia muris]
METRKRMEREINLLELVWDVLFGWRQIVCCGIVFAVLISGVKYIIDIKGYRPEQNGDIKQEEVELTTREKEQISNAQEIIKRLEEYQNYLDTSVAMQINPYEKHIIELQYYVKSDYTFNYTQDSQNDYTSSLVALYYNYIVGGEMSQAVIEGADLSISQADISELWSVTWSGNTISIKITDPEKEKLERIAEIVKSQLEKKEIEFQQIGSHELKLLGEAQNVVVDTATIDRKNVISNNIISMNTQLNSLKMNMTEQQLSILNSDLEEDSDSETVVNITPSVSKRYILLGMVLGIVIVCIWIVCKAIFTVKLQNSGEIRTLYNVRLLGEITVQSSKKRFLSVIDEKLLAIKNRRKKKLTTEQQIKILSANIALSCKQRRIDCIYITGSEYENIDVETLNMLKDELYLQNIQVKEGGNIFYDAESLKQGTEIGNMLFVEQIGRSIYDEISNELNLAKEQNNYILGVAVLM